MKAIAPLVWIAYVIVPVDGWGLYRGRPLGVFAATTLALFCWLWWTRLRQGDGGQVPLLLAVGALVVKIALGSLLLVPRGFDARYYANAQFAGAAEKGTEPADSSYTRVDRELRFGSAAARDLPLYFFNDSARFNFYLPNEPARASLPASVVWEGWVRVPRSRLWRVYMHTPGGKAAVTIGDGFSASVPPLEEWTAYPRLTEGVQPIRITFAVPQGGSRQFEAGWTVDGKEMPFDEAIVYRRSASRLRLAADAVVRGLSVAFDAGLFVWLLALAAGAVVRALRNVWRARSIRDAIAVAWIVAIANALWFARPYLHQMVTLSGGDDWLTYETRARDIGLNGILMLLGAPRGQGNPFFEMPFYPYFLAGTHWLFGDGLYGAHLMQRLLLGGTVITLWRLTAALWGERTGWIGLAAALVLAYVKLARWSGVLLTETIFVPLVCLWALLLVRLARREHPTSGSAAVAGAVGGLATLTRSTLMMGWPLALGLTAFGMRRVQRKFRLFATLAVALLAVISLATARNWIVARKFVLINAYGTFNLVLANAPPNPPPIPAAHQARYDRLGLDRNAQIVVESIRQAPGAFVELCARRAAYALGSFETLAPGTGRSPFYLGAVALALAGLVVVLLRPSWLPDAGAAAFIPLSLAAAHFGILAITFVSVYGDRLLLPFYALIVPYVAVSVLAVFRRVA